jgi:hypothetical protein
MPRSSALPLRGYGFVSATTAFWKRRGRIVYGRPGKGVSMIKKAFLGMLTLAVAGAMLAAPPTTTPSSSQTSTSTTQTKKHKKIKKNKKEKKDTTKTPSSN